MPTPSDSTIDAMVEAVPMVMQWPCERCMHDSASGNSSSVSLPARRSSDIDQTLVPDPMSWPRYLPETIGPPETKMVGISTLAAPINMEGVVLSQPPSSTTPSSGLPRVDPYPSIRARLREGL